MMDTFGSPPTFTDYQQPPPEKSRIDFRDDATDFDNAMENHATNLQEAFQNPNLTRGLLESMSPPSASRKRGPTRRASASVSSSGTSKHSRQPHRAGSLGHQSPSVDEISILINRLATERQKTANLQASLAQAQADLAFQDRRFEEANTRLSELKQKEEEGNARRKKTEVELSKLREQLRFLKTQYQGAIEEIKKAQRDIDTLDEERQKAVDETYREKEKVRRLLEERKLQEAREAGYQEGRKLGMEEGARMGKQEGIKYGVKDGKRAEEKKQKKAMMDLIQDDAAYEEQPRPEPPREPAVRETYHVVDAETPGQDGRGEYFVPPDIDRARGAHHGRSSSFPAPRGIAPVVTVDPQTHTANVLGLPVIGANSGVPVRSNSVDRSDANINILAGAGEFTDLADSPRRSISRRTSAPPQMPLAPSERPMEQRSWGGGVIGTGQGYRAPVKVRQSSGSRPGRSTVTPPSVAGSTPTEQFDLLAHGRGGPASNGPPHGRERSNSLFGREQVTEMTPILEAGSEPGPSPVTAYFQDAAMGVRPQERAFSNMPNGGGQTYIPKRSQPSPTAATGTGQYSRPPEVIEVPRRSPQPPKAQRKAPPVVEYGNVPASSSRAGSHVGRSNSRAGSTAPSAVGNMLPDIELVGSTPPARASDRSTKMAQAGASLMGSPAFVTGDVNYASFVPGNAQPVASGDYSQNGAPLGQPGQTRSPLNPRRELGPEDFSRNDPNGGLYHPANNHRRAPSTSLQQSPLHRGHDIPDPPRSPSRHDDRPPPSPRMGPPPSPSQFRSDLAHPTPLRYSNALDMSPEEITIHPSGMTPTPSQTTFAAASSGKKGKSSAKDKKRRREGFVDYDDEVPQITSMGYSVQDTEPPLTTPSRVQSMYGIPKPKGGAPQRTPSYSPAPLPRKTPAYESAPLPRKTPGYESAPLPPPKSARHNPGNLPTMTFDPAASFGAFNPVPSPQKSTTSSQDRRAMERDLDAPIEPYDPSRPRHDEADYVDSSSVVDILDERAESWDTRSNKFMPRKLPQMFEEGEVIPPQNRTPERDTIQPDLSRLGADVQMRPPPSPSMGVRGPPSAYVNTADFDENSVNLPSTFTVDQYGHPIRSPQRQSLPVTASARSSTNALPSAGPIQRSDIPWNTGRTTTSQLPRQSVYESAPTSAIMPQTSTTWAYTRDSAQTIPVGPIGNDAFGFGAGPFGSAQVQPVQLPPGSTRSNIMNIAPGTSRSIAQPLPPGTTRSIVQPLPPMQTQSQVMLANMLSPDANPPEVDEDPIIPSQQGGAKKKKKGGKKK